MFALCVYLRVWRDLRPFNGAFTCGISEDFRFIKKIRNETKPNNNNDETNMSARACNLASTVSSMEMNVMHKLA